MIAALFAILAPIIPIVMIVASQLSFAQVNDLPQYFAAGKLILEGKGALVYSLSDLFAAERSWFPALGQRGIGLFLAPCGLPLVVPVAFLPPAIAPVAWTLLLSAALIGSLLIIRRLYGLSLTAMLWLFAVVSLSGPAYESLRIGQPAPVLLLAFAGGLSALKSDRLVIAGLLFSVLLLKPQELLPIIIYLLGAKKYRFFLIICGFALVYFLIAFLEIGAGGFNNYAHLLGDPANMALMQPDLNPTLRGQLLRIPGVSSVLASVSSTLGLVLSCAFLYMLGARMADVKDSLTPGIIVALPLGLVTALHCHIYDLLLLVPSVVALTRCRLSGRIPSWLTLVGFVAMAPFLLPFYVNVHYNYLLKGGMVNPHFIVLFVLSLFLSVLVWRNRQDFQ